MGAFFRAVGFVGAVLAMHFAVAMVRFRNAIAVKGVVVDHARFATEAVLGTRVRAVLFVAFVAAVAVTIAPELVADAFLPVDAQTRATRELAFLANRRAAHFVAPVFAIPLHVALFRFRYAITIRRCLSGRNRQTTNALEFHIRTRVRTVPFIRLILAIRNSVALF